MQNNSNTTATVGNINTSAGNTQQPAQVQKPGYLTITAAQVEETLLANPGARYVPNARLIVAPDAQGTRVIAYITEKASTEESPAAPTNAPTETLTPGETQERPNPFEMQVEEASITLMESELLTFMETGAKPVPPTDPEEREQWGQALSNLNQSLRAWLKLTVTQEHRESRITRHREGSQSQPEQFTRE